MPRDLSGVYTLPPGNPVVSGAIIESAWANNTMGDLRDAISDSLDRNGRGGMLAPMKFTDGSAAAPGITFTNQPSTGIHRDTAAGHLELGVGGTARLRVNASGVVEIFVGGAWAALDITNLPVKVAPAGADSIAIFDATTNTLKKAAISALPGALLAVTVKAIAGTTTHVFNAAMQRVEVEALGGGGGGGGCPTTTATTMNAGGGGGAGGHAKRWMARSAFTGAELSSGIQCVVGAAGAGVSGAAGTNGGNTTFGTTPYLTANGGVGGSTDTSSTASSGGTGGLGGSPSGGDVNGVGASGHTGASTAGGNPFAKGGHGASSLFGGGGRGLIGGSGSSGAGQPATGNGAGGSGARAGFSSAVQIGGAGSPGLIVIVEYS
jgi:hypothetical protein